MYKKDDEACIRLYSRHLCTAWEKEGHAGAIISTGRGTAMEKMEALRKAGVTVIMNPARIGKTVV